MNSLLCCPVCGNPLTFAERSAYCKNGHTYDRAARGGYIHLLRQQRRGSSDPGDSAEMCQARTRFLEGGWYAPLRNQLAAQVKQLAPNDILDAGCGEGWYTHAISEALPHARIAGINLPAMRCVMPDAAVRRQRLPSPACLICRLLTSLWTWCSICLRRCVHRNLHVCCEKTAYS